MLLIGQRCDVGSCGGPADGENRGSKYRPAIFPVRFLTVIEVDGFRYGAIPRALAAAV